MELTKPSRLELEDVWRERLNDALRRYRIAKLEASTALIRERNEEIASPDGQFAFRKAQRAENMALAEYKHILTIFHNLVIDGKIPNGDA